MRFLFTSFLLYSPFREGGLGFCSPTTFLTLTLALVRVCICEIRWEIVALVFRCPASLRGCSHYSTSTAVVKG